MSGTRPASHQQFQLDFSTREEHPQQRLRQMPLRNLELYRASPQEVEDPVIEGV